MGGNFVNQQKENCMKNNYCCPLKLFEPKN